MAWKEVDYDLSKGAPYPKAVLTITSFKRRMKKGFNGILSLQAVKLLRRPARVKIFVDKKERLIGIKPARKGFKVSYSKQPQCLIPFTSVIKELGEEICGAFVGELKSEMLVFNLRKPLPYRSRGSKKHY